MKHAREDYNRIQDPAGKIPEDEPVFLIRGQDKCGPETLRFWARLAAEQGAHKDIVHAAFDQASEMEFWQDMCAQKVPDMPAPAKEG